MRLAQSIWEREFSSVDKPLRIETQEVSSVYTSPFLDTDELKGLKSFRGYRETGPWVIQLRMGL